MSIALENLTKFFGPHCVVNDVSLEVAEGELFVLLGPSGSGKSTVLRLIAGLLNADAGRVWLHQRDVTRLRPQRRDIGFVFQHYALFRHMSVAENVEFPLQIRRVKAAERRRRCSELLELVGLVGLEKRLPSQLSGGQQQRVALARALAHRPEVLLLDEPFGALDAKIRTGLRRSLRRIQGELGVTTLFVTHDQEEGFELADRMGVMNFGRLLEVGRPTELYLHPQTEFVAAFLGRANLMVGECSASSVGLGPVRFPLDDHIETAGGERRVQVLFRPEDVAVKDSPEALAWPLLSKAVVDEAGFCGSLEKIRLRLDSLAGVRAISPQVPFGADYLLVEATRSQHQARRYPLRPGDTVWIGVRRIHALTHPGLSFLLVTDGSSPGRGAVELGGQLARLAHARVTVLQLNSGSAETLLDLDRVREQMGSGAATLELRTAPDGGREALETECTRQPYDLVIHGRPRDRVTECVRSVLGMSDHHLLLVPPACHLPRSVLICVAVGESGIDHVRFAARLVRHLGAAATVLTVVPRGCSAQTRDQAERFLAAAARTFTLLGVRGITALRSGQTRDQILREIRICKHDLVVLGAPVPDRSGIFSFNGLVDGLLGTLADVPLLLVRSQRHDDADELASGGASGGVEHVESHQP